MTKRRDASRGPGGRGNKRDLPTKVCLVCGLPFTWRKKWERDWEQVRYCSERCKRAARRRDSGPAR